LLNTTSLLEHDETHFLKDCYNFLPGIESGPYNTF